MRLLSKIIKSSFVKQIEKQVEPDNIDFDETTALSLYEETKLLLAELVNEAQQRAAHIIASSQKEAKEIKSHAKMESEKIRAEAFQQGKQSGYQAGLSAGQEEMEILLKDIEKMLVFLGNYQEVFLQKKANEVIDLVLLIVEKIIGTLVNSKPEIIAGIVKNVLQVAGESEKLIIKVNPQHLPYLNSIDTANLAPGKISFQGDTTIEPGGCLIETEQGFIDACLGERLSILEKVLKEENRHVEL